jgi:hypothetical protein
MKLLIYSINVFFQLIHFCQCGFTALAWVAIKGHTECMRLLIDARADIHAKNIVRVGCCFDGASSGFLSHFRPRVVLFCLLLFLSSICMRLRCCSIGFGEFDLQWGSTALTCAAEEGHADFVRLLLDTGADKDAKDDVRVGRCFTVTTSYFGLHVPNVFSYVLPLVSLYFLCSLYFQFQHTETCPLP